MAHQPLPGSPARERRPAPLAPLRVRIVVYAGLVVVGLASIWLIDQRAMALMREVQAIAALPEDEAAARVEAIARADLRARYGERATRLTPLVPLRENQLRWNVLFVPETGPGDPPPQHTVQVHVDAATGRVQYVRHHR